MTFWKMQSYEEGKKLSGYRACRRGNGLKKQSTQDFRGSEITLCDTLNGEYVSLYHMLKLTERTISRVRPKANYALTIITCTSSCMPLWWGV